MFHLWACCLQKAMEVQDLVANDDEDTEAKHGL